MNKINQAVKDIHYVDDSTGADNYLVMIHPIAKVVVTLAYIVSVMSFDKCNILGLLGMGLYLIVLFITGEVSFFRALRQLKVMILFVVVLGSANAIFNRNVIFYVGDFGITDGTVSMITLIIKACFAVFATFLLVNTTSIEGICYGLRKLCVPSIIVTIVMLIYRYIILLLKEAERMTDAYKLRCAGKKGISYKAWGPFVGSLLLRCIDRADRVYEGMTLRGFNGEYYLNNKVKSKFGSMAFAFVWIAIFVFLRFVPVFLFVGNLFGM